MPPHLALDVVPEPEAASDPEPALVSAPASAAATARATAPAFVPDPAAAAAASPASLPPHFGPPSSWARDLSLLGAFTALLVPTLCFPLRVALRVAPVATLSAALTGWLLGRLAPRLFHPYVRRLPLALLLPAGFGLGALWGTSVGLVAALASRYSALHLVSYAGQTGALLLGSLWLPYLLAHARRRPTWPLVAVASVVTPVAASLVWLVTR